MHSCGLLKGSYQPDHEQESLRALVRHRKRLVLESNRFVLRIQKALELMNIKLHTVISDLMGQSGKAVLEAIIAGERNASNFLPLIHKRIKTDRAVIVKSLAGTRQAEDCLSGKGIRSIKKGHCIVGYMEAEMQLKFLMKFMTLGLVQLVARLL